MLIKKISCPGFDVRRHIAFILPLFSNFTAKLPQMGIESKITDNCKITAIDEVILQKRGII